VSARGAVGIIQIAGLIADKKLKLAKTNSYTISPSPKSIKPKFIELKLDI
jgi:hypothetical protein